MPQTGTGPRPSHLQMCIRDSLCSDHGKAVEQVILIMLPGIGVLLADGDHGPVDADKFFSAEIIHIFKVDDIGAVDPVKGFRRELLLQVRDIRCV